MRSSLRSSVVQILGISLREWRYAFIVWSSGCFDRKFYREEHPHLRKFWKQFPELHYVISGEAAGHTPNKTFNPNCYLNMNPDIAKYSDAAFLHFIRHGRAENRQCTPLNLNPQYYDGCVEPIKPWPCQADYAIVVHVYYPEIWNQIATRLAVLELEFDLIITLPDMNKYDALAEKIVSGTFPNAHIVRTPNIGRDIFPFVHLAQSGFLSQYKAVCKLHTKKSPHLSNGDDWRAKLVNGLLPELSTKQMLKFFLKAKKYSVLVPDPFYYHGNDSWGKNKSTTEKLLSTNIIACNGTPLHFPAGSMYWCKPEMIDALNGLNLTPNAFENETGQLDGTTAHAVERIIGYLADSIDKEICTTSRLLNRHDSSMWPSLKQKDKTFKPQRTRNRILFDH